MRAWEFRHGELVDRRYELLEPIGKGGMAEVWRAVDQRADRHVAVKFLRSTEDLQHQFDTRGLQDEIAVMVKRFERETALLDSFNHQGIPRLNGAGKHRGVPYLVMEYVDGMALNELLALRRPLTLGPAVAIAVQIADALACAHSLPVVHRDLKPQNVMISTPGIVKLLDFGIAKDLSPDATNYTKPGATLGSLGYQAPEQILGDPVTPKTDVYALGCVCYEMLTGRTPFVEGEGHGGLQGQHLKALPVPLAVFAPQVPTDLDDLILRMLAKDPDQRPEMEEISATLRRYLPLPGTPAPLPRLDPDPTLPFREPNRKEEEGSTAHEEPASIDHEPSAGWLTVRGVESDCDAAAQELATGTPGPAVARLSGLLMDARREWGPARPLVRKAGRLAADGMRILGDHGRAARLYEQLSDDLARSRGPEDRVIRLIWQLRAAECRLPFGDCALALEALHAAATAAANALSNTAADEVRAVCRELETRLNELGYGPDVQQLLERLERELG